MAKIIQQEYRDALGREAGLSVLSRVCLVLGIAGVLGCILAGAFTGRLVLIAAGAGVLVLGLVLNVLFGALAEIIMLLKTSAGLPHSGTISGTSTGTIHVCSDCGSLNYADVAKCRKCGVEFEKDGQNSSPTPERQPD